MSTTIGLCKVSFDEHTIHSAPSLSTTISGDIYDPLNIVNPTVEVNVSNVEQYNMIQIKVNSNRFYWIKEYEYIGEGNVCKLHCESAVLVNWRSAINETTAILDYTTNYFNEQLANNEYPILAQRCFHNYPFTQLRYKDCYLLTVLGG